MKTSLFALILSAVPAAAQDVSFKTAMDKTADPCADFFQYACGDWLAHNEIPSDQTRWGRFNELIERNRLILKDILEKDPAKIGDFYASCMDEKAADAAGVLPLRPEFERIGKLQSLAGLPKLLALEHLRGSRAMFEFGSTPDFKDSSRMIAVADQGGLGLPDRDYYLKEDAKSLELRAQYAEHVRKMFELSGDPAEEAAGQAKTVVDIETLLAKASMSRTDRRDPDKVYHKMSREDFRGLSSSFRWAEYYGALGAPEFSALNAAAPDFFKGLEALLPARSLGEWKTYLRWHLLHSSAEVLSAPFVEENFDFYGRKLSGQKENKPRWKRCVAYSDQALGEALGKAYVARAFGPGSKERMLRLVRALEAALGKDIAGLPWMTETTRKKAAVKLAAITDKIGYPEKWRDYSKLAISRGDLYGNSVRAAEFSARRELAKIGKPVDKKEWYMTPPTVNAYYDPTMNNINFPAGILQPPFFDAALDDAVNFGAIGVVIGHELTHGFDDEGRKFDAKGNLSDWWTPEDAKEFETRATCLADQYSTFTATAEVKVNGRLTLGENTADNGGVRVALMALEAQKPSAPIDALTSRQRLFLGFANVWCMKQTGESARMRAMTDPHSPGRYRVNGVVANMPEFKDAFRCKDDAPMVSPKPCRVW